MIIESIDWPGAAAVHDPEVYLLDYVPPEQRVEVTRAYVIGYANCLSAAAYLSKQGQLPKPRLVAQMMSIVPGLDKGASKAYLDAGGAPEFGLDAVLARVEEEYEDAGDGSFVQDEANAAALGSLPECRNDAQFQLLRQQLFSNSDFWPCGPYTNDDDDAAAGGELGDDGWVHYDTSNWVPPAAAGGGAPRADGGAAS